MANDYDDIEQVISFITSLDQASASRLASELSRMTNSRVEQVRQSEMTIAEIQAQAASDRAALGKRELTKLEDQLTSRVDKELQQLQRLKEANEKEYSDVIARAQQAKQYQVDVTTALNTEQLARYETFQRNKAVLAARYRDAERAADEKQSLWQWANDPKSMPGQEGRNMAASAVGWATSKQPAVTEQDKQTKIMGGMAENVLKSRTPLEALVNVGKGIYDLVDLGIKEAARRERESMEAIAGTGQEVGGETHEMLQKLLKTMEDQASITKEQKEAMSSTIGAILRTTPGMDITGKTVPGSVGHEEAAKSGDILIRTILDVRATATMLGMSWTELATMSGEAARKHDLAFNEGMQYTQQMFLTLKDYSKEVAEINIPNAVKNIHSLADSLLPFGYTIEDSTRFVAKFAKELDRGILSLGDLQKWITGMTGMDEGKAAFVFQQVRAKTAGDADFAELNKVLAAVGTDPLAQARATKLLQERDITGLRSLGLGTEVNLELAAEQFNPALGATARGFAEDFAGDRGNQFQQDAYYQFMREQLDLTGSGEGKGQTQQQKRAGQEILETTAKGSKAFADASVSMESLVPTIDETNDRFIKLAEAIDDANESFRRAADSSWFWGGIQRRGRQGLAAEGEMRRGQAPEEARRLLGARASEEEVQKLIKSRQLRIPEDKTAKEYAEEYTKAEGARIEHQLERMRLGTSVMGDPITGRRVDASSADQANTMRGAREAGSFEATDLGYLSRDVDFLLRESVVKSGIPLPEGLLEDLSKGTPEEMYKGIMLREAYEGTTVNVTVAPAENTAEAKGEAAKVGTIKAVEQQEAIDKANSKANAMGSTQ